MSFFRRRSFWEKLSGGEKTPIEKFEGGCMGCFEVIIIIAFILYFCAPVLMPVLEILDIILSIISLIF